jgi:hypothetical protein
VGTQGSRNLGGVQTLPLDPVDPQTHLSPLPVVRAHFLPVDRKSTRPVLV